MKRMPDIPELTVEEMYSEIEKIAKALSNKGNKIDIYDEFTSTDMLNKNYVDEDGRLDENELLNDIQRILVFIDVSPPRFVIKEVNSDSNCIWLNEISQSECRNKFTNFLIPIINEKGKKKYLKVWNFIQTNLKHIAFKQVQFFSENQQVFSMFRGFPFRKLPMFDFNIIKNFLWHMKFIICNGNDECFSYFSKWLSFIFRHPGEKTQTAILLTGIQGAGKTALTVPICKLLGCYANPNAKLSNVFGSFNLGIMNKMLIIINEVGTFTELTNDQNNRIKTAITEEDVDINPKHQNSFSSKNIANFIFISNESEPLKIEIDDRRFMVLEVNGEYKDNVKYFKALYDSYKAPGFHENLLTYFLLQKVDTMRDIPIPFTEAKEQIQLECSGYFAEFIDKNKKLFINGVSVHDAKQLYAKWTLDKHIRPLNDSEYNRNMKRFCEKKKIGPSTQRVNAWFLNNEQKSKIKEKEEEVVQEEEEEEEEVVQKEEVHEEEEEEEFPPYISDDNDDDDILSFF